MSIIISSKEYAAVILGYITKITNFAAVLFHINLFSANVPLLYPAENIRKPTVLWWFQGVEVEHCLKMG